MICYGPVPSRRLGKSLGINNIPSPKVCTYSCIYCQVGATNKYGDTPQVFYEPEHIFTEVKKHLEDLGFVAGGTVSIVSSLGGNVIVKVKEARVAISEEMARKIMV